MLCHLIDSVQGAVDEAAAHHLRPEGVPHLQYSTVQYSTVQYSTVQYSTVQYRVPHRGVRGQVEELHPAPVPGCLQDGQQTVRINTGAHCRLELSTNLREVYLGLFLDLALTIYIKTLSYMGA